MKLQEEIGEKSEMDENDQYYQNLIHMFDALVADFANTVELSDENTQYKIKVYY